MKVYDLNTEVFFEGKEDMDWRDLESVSEADDNDDDDDELEETPKDVISFLGFDPKELNFDEDEDEDEEYE